MIIIIGAGLSGLLTGHLLKKEGIPFVILEARNRVGGRINTLYGANKAPIEMGATWFTNQHSHLIALLEELDIEHFEQHIGTKVFYQASSASPTQLVQIPAQSLSYRIAGGTSNLINTLLQKLDSHEVLLDQSVTQIIVNSNSVRVKTEKTFEGDAVVVAIPPKLWAKNILFEPQLPSDLLHVAMQTQTWMEDSIKIAMTYNQPFWEQKNISGTLFSNAGPITELYDHSDHKRSNFALCGFIDSSLKVLSYEDRRKRVLGQMKNVFGEEAGEFTHYEECIWSNEVNTFEDSDVFLSPHQNNGHPIFGKPIFGDKLLISSSESALEFPGYMEGAVIAAHVIAKKIEKAQQ